MYNSFGNLLKITSFGESHGAGLGVILDGFPAGFKINLEDIQKDLNRRRPGQSEFTTKRQEADEVEILSGFYKGQTTGAPIALLVRNTDAKSGDYKNIRNFFRPGHADWSYFKKYNLPPQPGGGRSSGRETLARVAAGAIVRKFLEQFNINVRAFTIQVGEVQAQEYNFNFAETDPLRFADKNLAPKAHKEVRKAMQEGDSLGSVVEVRATGVPAGLGEPIYQKLSAALGFAFFSIGAVKAVEFGEGLKMASQKGSAANDALGENGPLTNKHGGILGGISTGQPIISRLFIKPTPSINFEQETINLSGEKVKISTHGRHDPCLAPRLAVVAEAMAILTIGDFILLNNSGRNLN